MHACDRKRGSSSAAVRHACMNLEEMDLENPLRLNESYQVAKCFPTARTSEHRSSLSAHRRNSVIPIPAEFECRPKPGETLFSYCNAVFWGNGDFLSDERIENVTNRFNCCYRRRRLSSSFRIAMLSSGGTEIFFLMNA